MDFMELVQEGRLLQPYSIYNQLQEDLPQQLLNTYRFLSLAKDWKSFQRNACYARIHLHPVLFVNALQLAMIERTDTQDLQLPDMHEVLPQVYFDRRVILAAQQTNWQQLSPSPRISWRETLHNILFRQRVELQLIPSQEPLIINVQPAKAQLSLDVSLRSYWNRLLSRQLMEQHEQSHHDLFFLQNVRQLSAHLQLEELAVGSSNAELDSDLLTTGGVPYRSLALEVEAVRQLISASIVALRTRIDKQLQADAGRSQCVCTVGRVIANEYWQMCRQLSRFINGNRTEPNLMAMGSSNLRDPIYRELVMQLDELMSQFDGPMETSVSHRLHVRNIFVGQLETFEQTVYSDLINLLDQQLLQTQRNNLQLLQRRLMARHIRLNHKAFNMSYEIFAWDAVAIRVRSYLLPMERNHPRLLLDEFIDHIEAGKNQLNRTFSLAPIGHTLSDLYEARQPFAPFAPNSMYSFPPHLQLPRGTTEGLNLRLYVQILPKVKPSTACAWNSNEPLLASRVMNVTIRHHGLN